MCGIAGVLALKPPLPIDRTVLVAMARALVHRGPDGEGFYLDRDVGLAHTRLSIVDIEHGHQPMSNEDDSLWLVSNGEIYNHTRYRLELQARGHRFKTRSDSEVILHLYEEHGDESVRYLSGMFAFALWDRPRCRLLLARDRIGIKPLYYAMTAESLVFASEAKAIFASGLVRPELDPRSVDNFFSFVHPIPPRSMFRDIVQVPPAHILSIEAGNATARRYWQVPFEDAPRVRSVRAYADDLLAVLETSVSRHLMGDVPVGAYLSGGIDSTVVVALTKRLGCSDLRTFSVGFTAARYDESPLFRATAETLGLVNHEITLDRVVAESYPAVLWHLEMPCRYPVSLAHFHLSRFVREHGFKTVLSGEGSDELFGGYDVYRADKFRRWVARLPVRTMRRAAYAGAVFGYSRALDGLDSLYAAHFADPAALRARYGCVPPWYRAWRLLDEFRPDIFSDEIRDALASVDPEAELVEMDKTPMRDLHPLNAALYLEMQMRLPGWILPVVDRCTMAHGVELRVPFLDPEVVEFCARLPVELKLRGFTEKYLLRVAARGLIPDAVVRRRKFAFSVPVDRWFFAGQIPEFAEAMLADGALREVGVFRPAAVARARAELAASRVGTHRGRILQSLIFGIIGIQTLAHEFRPSRFRRDM